MPFLLFEITWVLVLLKRNSNLNTQRLKQKASSYEDNKPINCFKEFPSTAIPSLGTHRAAHFCNSLSSHPILHTARLWDSWCSRGGTACEAMSLPVTSPDMNVEWPCTLVTRHSAHYWVVLMASRVGSTSSSSKQLQDQAYEDLKSISFCIKNQHTALYTCNNFSVSVFCQSYH